MKLGESIRKNTLWILTGNLGGRVVGFVFGIVLARLLVPADFGMLVTIQIFTGMAGFFAAGGMGVALIQAKTVEEHHYQIVFTMQLLICTIIYAGFYSIAPWFSIWFDNPLYTDLLRVSTLNFLIRPFVNIPKARLKRDMRFKNIAVNGFISMLAGGAASIIMAKYDMGPWSLVLGGLVGSLVNVVIFNLTVRRVIGIRFEAGVARRLGTYGIKISANEIIMYLRNQTSNLIISRLLGPTFVGLYNKADSLNLLPIQTIGGSAYQTVFRALSKVQDNLDQSKYIYFRTITLVTVYTLPFYVALLWLAEPFIVFVYGAKWATAATPLQILALSGLFRCVSSPSGAVVAAQNRLGYEIRIQIETWVLLTVGCVIGINWGINGVAWGILPSFAYSALRLAWLANGAIQGNFIDLKRSLEPAIILNTIMLCVLLVTHLLLPTGLKENQPGSYLLAMSITGGLCYGLLFLYSPIPALAGESQRWKKLLRLATD